MIEPDCLIVLSKSTTPTYLIKLLENNIYLGHTVKISIILIKNTSFNPTR